MNLSEFYNTIGGSYDNIKSRFQSDNMILKFVYKFKNEQTFSQLEYALNNKDYKSAFIAAHTLKGISLNLSFDSFYNNVFTLTEMLRPFHKEDFQSQGITDLFTTIKNQYKIIIDTIDKLLTEE